MSNKVDRSAAAGSRNHSDEIVDQSGDPIPIPPVRSPRSPTPPHVIPHNAEPLPQQRGNPIPNGRIVRIPMNKNDRRPVADAALIDGQPHPTSLNPPSTHKTTVAANPESACAKLPTVTTEPT
jgi:hypothetical protein